jgi:hypothetical protein
MPEMRKTLAPMALSNSLSPTLRSSAEIPKYMRAEIESIWITHNQALLFFASRSALATISSSDDLP